MRKFVSFLFLLPVLAFAGPMVGDQAVYVGSMVINGQSTPVVYTRTLKAINADMATIEEKFEGAGQVDVGTSEEKLDEMMNDETGLMVVQNCAQFGGELMNITVAFGALSACKMIGDNNTIAYIAAVPFGIAKLENVQYENAVLSFELKSATKGE